jgi:hypothetical protein
VSWLYPLISDPAVPPWAPLAERLKSQVGISLRTAKHVVQAWRRARVLMRSVRRAEPPRARFSPPAAERAAQAGRRGRMRTLPGEPALWSQPEPRVRFSLPAAGAGQVARQAQRRKLPGVPAFCSQPQPGFSRPAIDHVARARRQARWQEAEPPAPSRPQAAVRVWQRRVRRPLPVATFARSAEQRATAWGPAVRPRVPALQQESDRP